MVDLALRGAGVVLLILLLTPCPYLLQQLLLRAEEDELVLRGLVLRLLASATGVRALNLQATSVRGLKLLVYRGRACAARGLLLKLKRWSSPNVRPTKPLCCC
jgi:hypothetical protein